MIDFQATDASLPKRAYCVQYTVSPASVKFRCSEGVPEGNVTEQSQPLTQAQDHDRRIGRLEGIVEQLNYRLDSIERGQRWIIGIQITTLIAIGSLLFSILNKLPG